MTIWDAFCDPSWRIWFEKSLMTKGMSPIQMRTVMDHFFYFLQRIKSSGVSVELESITDSTVFIQKLNYIFHDLWKDYISEGYEGMYDIFVEYLKFLDSIQAFKGVFFTDELKSRYNKRYPPSPNQLSSYETDFLQDGKLTLLANPLLLSSIRLAIAAEISTVKDVHSLCLNFYGDLLPRMKASDYSKLVKSWWKPEGRSNKFLISFPNGLQELFHSEDAVRAVIKWYGPEEVASKHLSIRSRDFLISRLPFDHPEEYVRVSTDAPYYFCVLGNYKDRYNAMNTINAMFGKKLRIELSL